jgi:hypothetical protein
MVNRVEEKKRKEKRGEDNGGIIRGRLEHVTA